jgi:hypothetical protein
MADDADEKEELEALEQAALNEDEEAPEEEVEAGEDEAEPEEEKATESENQILQRIFYGDFENLPSLPSKIVRIFTSSTFTGPLM